MAAGPDDEPCFGPHMLRRPPRPPVAPVLVPADDLQIGDRLMGDRTITRIRFAPGRGILVTWVSDRAPDQPITWHVPPGHDVAIQTRERSEP